MLGVHSPRFRFTAERDLLAPALGRLGIAHAVADDSGYALWHDYGCKGWPSLFLWGQGGALRWYHFGEGEYEATERAIAAELQAIDSTFIAPDPMPPLRPSDAPDALVAPPSDELLPGGSITEPWQPPEPGATLALDYAAGGAHASIAGTGELTVAVDGGEPRSIVVGAPGLYDLANHPRHEHHALELTPSDGVEPVFGVVLRGRAVVEPGAGREPV